MIDHHRFGALFVSIYSTIAAAATWSTPFDFIGLPAPVVFMAFAGTAAGLVLQPPKGTRRTMFLLTLALTFFASVATVFLGKIPHMEWTLDASPAIAGLLGLFAQALVPAVRRRLASEVTERGATNGSSGGAP